MAEVADDGLDDSFRDMFVASVSVVFNYQTDRGRREAADKWCDDKMAFQASRVSHVGPIDGTVMIIYGFADRDVAFEFKMRFG